tara:strand:+ start:9152 stop:10510 length:1359 start_codon:yes stop_codon:yes gene_type:complete
MIKLLGDKKSVIIGDEGSDTSIISLWTLKEAVAKKLEKKEYALIGQLYNGERGIDMVLRALLANSQLTKLIITGNDLSKSGIVLSDFFHKGFEEGITKSTQKDVWKIKSRYDGYIGKDIPKAELELLRKSVTCVTLEKIEKLKDTHVENPTETRKSKVYKRKEDDFMHYVSEERSFIIRNEKTVAVWLESIDFILKFGQQVESAHGVIKEIPNLVVEIVKEDADKIFIPNAFPYDKKYLDEYAQKFLKSIKGFDKCIKELDKHKEAVIMTKEDTIVAIRLSLRNGFLEMNVFTQSQDFFSGFPQDAIALINLQNEIKKHLIRSNSEKTIQLGSLVVNASGAYMLEAVSEACKDIIEKYYAEYIITEPSEKYDPRGNFIISLEDGKIRVQFTTKNGEHIKTFEGVSAYALRKKIIRECIVSSAEHGVYVGIELMKAETALKLKKPYVQDQPLK